MQIPVQNKTIERRQYVDQFKGWLHLAAIVVTSSLLIMLSGYLFATVFFRIS